MPKLDRFMSYDEDRVTLECHSSRVPDEQVASEILEAVAHTRNSTTPRSARAITQF